MPIIASRLTSSASCSSLQPSVPAATKIRVWDSTAELRYLVVPMPPAGTEGWSEERLAELVSRDAMIGTALAQEPQQTRQPA